MQPDEVEEILTLSKEIIDDAELKKTSVETLVSKASRLASLVNDEKVKDWLLLEKYGYSDSEPSLSIMAKTGRTYDKTTRIGLWGSISTQESAIEGVKAEIEVVKNFKPSGTYSTIQFNSQLQQVQLLNAKITQYKRICSIVSLSILDFASRIHYAYKFGKRADSILDDYRKTTLEGIVKHFPNLNQSFEIIARNSTSNNERGWSSAALECRNVLTHLADSLWKVKNDKYKCRDDQEIKVENEKNKLIAYIDTKMGSTNEGKAKAKKLFGIIHEVFTLGGKSKRKIDEKELSTILINLYVFINDLINYTDLKPVDEVKDTSE